MGPIWGTLFGPNSKRAGLAGKSLSEAKDTMTEIEYAFRLTMAQSGPKLHELYLKMMNTALSASEREAAAKDYRKEVEDIYAPRVNGIKDVMDKTAQQYLAIGGISPDKYSTDKVLELIKMMGSDPDKVKREYSDFFAGYQSIGDDISGNLVNTMEAYYNATNEMNTSSMAAMLKKSFRPVWVPLEMACNTLPRSCWNCNECSMTDSVCGQIILAITMDPGIAITEADNRCLANSTCEAGSPPANILI